jgi:hypothetical protein
VPGCLEGFSAAVYHALLEASVTTTAVIVLGIVTWVLMPILLALLARVNQLNSRGSRRLSCRWPLRSGGRSWAALSRQSRSLTRLLR